MKHLITLSVLASSTLLYACSGGGDDDFEPAPQFTTTPVSTVTSSPTTTPTTTPTTGSNNASPFGFWVGNSNSNSAAMMISNVDEDSVGRYAYLTAAQKDDGMDFTLRFGHYMNVISSQWTSLISQQYVFDSERSSSDLDAPATRLFFQGEGFNTDSISWDYDTDMNLDVMQDANTPVGSLAKPQVTRLPFQLMEGQFLIENNLANGLYYTAYWEIYNGEIYGADTTNCLYDGKIIEDMISEEDATAMFNLTVSNCSTRSENGFYEGIVRFVAPDGLKVSNISLTYANEDNGVFIEAMKN